MHTFRSQAYQECGQTNDLIGIDTTVEDIK